MRRNARALFGHGGGARKAVVGWNGNSGRSLLLKLHLLQWTRVGEEVALSATYRPLVGLQRISLHKVHMRRAQVVNQLLADYGGI